MLKISISAQLSFHSCYSTVCDDTCFLWYTGDITVFISPKKPVLHSRYCTPHKKGMRAAEQIEQQKKPQITA